MEIKPSTRLILILATDARKDRASFVNSHTKEIMACRASVVCICPDNIESLVASGTLKPEIVAADTTLIVRTDNYNALSEEIRMSVEILMGVKECKLSVSPEEYIEIGLCINGVMFKTMAARLKFFVNTDETGRSICGSYIDDLGEPNHFDARDLTFMGLNSDKPTIVLFDPITVKNIDIKGGQNDDEWK